MKTVIPYLLAASLVAGSAAAYEGVFTDLFQRFSTVCSEFVSAPEKERPALAARLDEIIGERDSRLAEGCLYTAQWQCNAHLVPRGAYVISDRGDFRGVDPASSANALTTVNGAIICIPKEL